MTSNSQFGNFNNWALSGGYRMTDALRAVASVGTSFQAPTFNQLYYPGFGNAALLPQQNRATELGLKYHAGDVSWAAVVYHNDIQGFIDPDHQCAEFAGGAARRHAERRPAGG